jgi:hypothetical protein
MFVGQREMEGDDSVVADVRRTYDRWPLHRGMVVTVATTLAAARLFFAELLALARRHELDCLADCGGAWVVKHSDPDLPKTRKRTPPNPTGDQSADAVLLEHLYRSHAATVLVACIREHYDFPDVTVGDRNEREGSTVAKVTGNQRVKSTWRLGRDSN